jgi:uncharacterized membrane protein YqiK
MNQLYDVLIYAGIILFAIFAIGLIFARLYKRSSKEVSFVRTGFGGQKVVMNGGALVFPVLHEIIPVNMNTLRLEVRRSNEQALITRDRMRVDVLAEFYVRVKPTQESIANAAQTLGLKTMKPDSLRDLVEGKFVDALRAVAAEMAMTELHEQRVDFVQKVQQVVSEDLLKNGLELEAVSLTGLDQTSKEYFNPNNAFDAEGLTKLTEEIEVRRKRRNEIEQDTMVSIRTKDLEAEREKLEIGKEEEYAKLQQEREIEIRRAAQTAEIASEQAQKRREAEQAQITAQQKIDLSTILAERAVEEERIDKERQIREKEIFKARAIETTDIEKVKTVELAEQDRAIVIAEKSRETSEAEASIARAKAVKEDERVITAQEQEKADRQKQIELIEAQKIAERQAITVTVAAEAEKQAAEDQAEAVRTIAIGDSDSARIAAQGDADAEKLAADAAKMRYMVDAEGKRSINEASNILSAEQIEMQVKMAIVKHMPDIIRESVKPMEQIDGIKIMQIDGLNSIGGGSNGNGSNGSNKNDDTNLADQVVNSALKYKVQSPIVDSLLSEIGIDGDSLNGLTQSLTNKKKSVPDSSKAES